MAAAGAVWEDKFGDGTRAYVDMRVVGSRNSNGRYSGVSIRAKPLLAAKKIGVLPEGIVVRCVEQQNAWYKLEGTGWCVAVYKGHTVLEEATAEEAAQHPAKYSLRVASKDCSNGRFSGLNIREEPNVESDKIGFFPDGAIITCADRLGEWYKLRGSGWVVSVHAGIPLLLAKIDVSHDNVERRMRVTVDSSGSDSGKAVKIRAYPERTAKVTGYLPNDSTALFEGRQGPWYCLKGGSGWCVADTGDVQLLVPVEDYEPVEGVELYRIASCRETGFRFRGVNVRAEPDPTSPKIGSLPEKTVVEVEERRGLWFKLSRGWCAAVYEGVSLVIPVETHADSDTSSPVIGAKQKGVNGGGMEGEVGDKPASPAGSSSRSSLSEVSDDTCVVCMSNPRNATIVHGDTGHVVCCLSCAQDLQARGNPCPICRAPINLVIRQFTC